jgi:extradiol dioxygenase family protein
LFSNNIGIDGLNIEQGKEEWHKFSKEVNQASLGPFLVPSLLRFACKEGDV